MVTECIKLLLLQASKACIKPPVSDDFSLTWCTYQLRGISVFRPQFEGNVWPNGLFRARFGLQQGQIGQPGGGHLSRFPSVNVTYLSLAIYFAISLLLHFIYCEALIGILTIKKEIRETDVGDSAAVSRIHSEVEMITCSENLSAVAVSH